MSAIVFPAQAGVFLLHGGPARGWQGFPRASGGVSCSASQPSGRTPFSPRKRGCFWPAWCCHRLRPVFPAQAGVFPFPTAAGHFIFSFPRASGGVSDAVQYTLEGGGVFPAQAGVFQNRGQSDILRLSFPRASGGVSFRAARQFHLQRFSPRKRGCFWKSYPRHLAHIVFPAQAGVFLSRTRP